jgi:hypothetical protein
MSPRAIALRVLGTFVLCVSTLAVACASQARAQSAWWRLNATSAPSNLPLQKNGVPGEAQIVVTANNVGDRDVSASSEDPIILTDELPAGLTVLGVAATVEGEHGEPITEDCPFTALSVTCTLPKSLPPYAPLLLRISVRSTLTQPPQPTLANLVRAQGGESPAGTPTPPAAISQALTFSEAPTSFGVESYELAPEGEAGEVEAQAGSHPFQLTTTLNLNQTLHSYSTAEGDVEPGLLPSAPALPQNFNFTLPPGLVGDATAVPACSAVAFSTVGQASVNLCPPDTAIGVASVLINDPAIIGFQSFPVPVFNLEPAAGEPARFGFEVEHVPVVLETSLPSGGEYGVHVSVKNASQVAQVLSTQLTLWGVPGDPSHDESRGWECLDSGKWETTTEPRPLCHLLDEQSPTAFLTLPTSCEPLAPSSVSGSSWAGGPEAPEQEIKPSDPHTLAHLPTLSGCDALEFNPSFSLTPESSSAATPTGVNAAIHMPQAGLLSAEGRAESALLDASGSSEGLTLNASAANALQTCGALQFGFEGPIESEQIANRQFNPGVPGCPDAAKVGTVQISTPLLSHELTGSLYLAAEHVNPFQSPLVLYLVAEDPADGILVKLAGTATIEEGSGRVTAAFQNAPDLPFQDLRLHFFGGPRADLATPAACGPYHATITFTGWAGVTTDADSQPFQINSGPGGSACSDPLPFTPSFAAGPTNPSAGAFASEEKPFVVNIGRPDGDQALTGITLHLPPGASAVLRNAKPCAEPPPGQEWSCGGESKLGHVNESAGLGSEPVTLTGELFLTSGYDGAPFGLLVRTHAAAGPFDLGYVNVRSRINVDPHTAAATITTDSGPRGEAIPTMLKGVPVQLKALQVVVDRPNFEFNPTNCSPLAFTGTLNGDRGASVGVSTPFIAAGCSGLPFHPTLEAFTQAHASKAGGASLIVRVKSSPGQANIAKTSLTLPKALPSRLTTIQKACVDATFEANPAACPEGSNIGTATAVTPQLNEPLSGPAYLVSHGNAAFPDVEFVLTNKEGIELILDGTTDIKKGITYSRFESVPDAPVTSFEAVLPEGPHSALATNLPTKDKYNFCGQKLTMPTVMTGQNGAVREQQTKVAVTGCNVKGSKSKKLSRKQKLAKALKACRKKFKRNKHRRAACEKKARKKYGPKKKAKKKSKKR